MTDIAIAFTLNDARKEAVVPPNILLVDYLRDIERLKGAKIEKIFKKHRYELL